MKIGDLVVSKAYQNYSDIVPAKLVLQVTNDTKHVVLEDDPNIWKLARNFFVVSAAPRRL